MNSELVTRSYPVDLVTRDENNTGAITGRPIVYNSLTDLGWFDEVIDAGALDETDLTDVRLCLNHDTSYVYARSRRNNPASTMRLTPDSEGLLIEADLAIEESPKAKDFYTAIRRKDISSMSFMFSVDADSWENLDSEHPTRHITKIGSVVEVSAVTFPAYEQTEINTRNRAALDNARVALEKAKEQRDLKTVDTDKSKELELLKAKISILGG